MIVKSDFGFACETNKAENIIISIWIIISFLENQ